MRLSRSCSFAVVALLTACSDPAGLDEILEVSLSVATDVVTYGEPTIVTVNVTNHSLKTVKLPRSACFYWFVVLDADGQVVGPEPPPCLLLSSVPVELSRGETYTISQGWAGSGIGESVDESGLLPPGTYWLRGRVGPAESPPVEIRLEEAAETDA